MVVWGGSIRAAGSDLGGISVLHGKYAGFSLILEEPYFIARSLVLAWKPRASSKDFARGVRPVLDADLRVEVREK
ncbi:hypothetical protein CQ018_04735 [Arthrobacter sp. MYb227]|nr:hypothetical protein CQ018_04735 [Arthrobacter sp. MYb227]